MDGDSRPAEDFAHEGDPDTDAPNELQDIARKLQGTPGITDEVRP